MCRKSIQIILHPFRKGFYCLEYANDLNYRHQKVNIKLNYQKSRKKLFIQWYIRFCSMMSEYSYIFNMWAARFYKLHSVLSALMFLTLWMCICILMKIDRFKKKYVLRWHKNNYSRITVNIAMYTLENI